MIKTQGLVEQLHFVNVCLYHKHHAGDTEGAPLFRATRAKILEGQKRAKKRVLFFFMIYIISGVISEGNAIKIMFTVIVQILSAIAFGIDNIIVPVLMKAHHALYSPSTRQRVYVLLLLEVYNYKL